ncbi:MAG: hypothetical protein MAG451_02605 [Anaerolineales bacterium]|nr:hypothetical protein [Anaerolineales bacterium]
MRGVLQLGIVVFAIALGVVTGNRLSSEAMAVVVGVVCGVLASIPMSVMILVLTRRLSKPARSDKSTLPAQHRPSYPPVVVVQSDGGGQRSQFGPAWDAPAAAENQPWRRSFTVVGEEDDWS